MPKRIIFPINIGDYQRDTTHLSTFEHGVYWLLMMFYWNKGGLPDDEKVIRRIAKVEAGAIWNQTLPVIRALFEQPGWRHKRIDQELAKQGEFSRRMKAVAARRWERSPVDKHPTIVASRNADNPLKSHDQGMRSRMLSLSKIKKEGQSISDPPVENPPPARRSSRAERRAFEAVEAGLRHDLGDGYAAAVDMLAADPLLVERCTSAELRDPGSGKLVAMIALKRATG